MRLILAVIFLLLVQFVYGQTKTYYIPVSPKGDTAQWYKSRNAFIEKIGLKRLDTISDGIHLRLMSDKMCVDIWQQDNGTFSGSVTNWTNELVDSREKPTNRTFTMRWPMCMDSVKRVMNLLTTSKILMLPTDDSIPGWKTRMFDGYSYDIEYVTKDSYSIKKYFAPLWQGQLIESIYVQTFFDSVFTLSNSEKLLKEFEKDVPFEIHGYGAISAVKPLTKKQRKKYYKEREHYRNEHSLD